MLSVHTCPLATLGGKETGGMNVYVRDLARELTRRGHRVDVYTRSQDPTVPRMGSETRFFLKNLVSPILPTPKGWGVAGA
jgi:D-inositol-3-phosphate glycosyltransferase